MKDLSTQIDKKRCDPKSRGKGQIRRVLKTKTLGSKLHLPTSPRWRSSRCRSVSANAWLAAIRSFYGPGMPLEAKLLQKRGPWRRFQFPQVCGGGVCWSFFSRLNSSFHSVDIDPEPRRENAASTLARNVEKWGTNCLKTTLGWKWSRSHLWVKEELGRESQQTPFFRLAGGLQNTTKAGQK